MSTDDLVRRAREAIAGYALYGTPALVSELADRIDNDALTLAEDERTMRRLADAIDRLETRAREDQMRADIWRDREDRYELTIKGLEVELHEAKTERDAARGELARTEEQIHEDGGFIDHIGNLEDDLSTARAALERVRGVHVSRPFDYARDLVTFGQHRFPAQCSECRSEYPCQTARALEGES